MLHQQQRMNLILGILKMTIARPTLRYLPLEMTRKQLLTKMASLVTLQVLLEQQPLFA